MTPGGGFEYRKKLLMLSGEIFSRKLWEGGKVHAVQELEHAFEVVLFRLKREAPRERHRARRRADQMVTLLGGGGRGGKPPQLRAIVTHHHAQPTELLAGIDLYSVGNLGENWK